MTTLDRTPTAVLWALLVVTVPAIGIVAAMSPAGGIAVFLAIALGAASLRAPIVALGAFTVVTYFEVLVVSQLLSPIKLAGGLVLVVAIGTVFARLQTDRSWRPAWGRYPIVLGLLLAFVVFSFASLGWAENMTQWKKVFQALATNAMLFLAVGIICSRLRDLYAIAWCALAAGTMSALYGMLNNLTIGGDRGVGSFGDPNEYAAVLVATIALGYAAFDSADRIRYRMIAAGGLSVCTLALLQTQSRGGIAAFLVLAMAIAFSSRGQERARLLGAGLMLAAITGAFLFSPPGQTFLGRVASDDSSGRTDLWHVAVREFVANPVAGVGLGNYAAVSRDYIDGEIQRADEFIDRPTTTHSIYLETLAEGGVVGATLFFSFLLATLGLLRMSVRRARAVGDRALVTMGRSLFAGTLGMLVSGVFLSGQYQEMLWLLLGIAPVYSVLVWQAASRQLQEQRDEIRRALELAQAEVAA